MVAIAAIGAAAAVGGTVTSAIAQGDAADTANQNAAAQNKYSADVYNIKVNYQKQLEAYQDTEWKSDLDFATSTLNYQKNEFSRQETFVAASAKNIIANENAEVSQGMLKSVQEGIANSLQQQEVRQRVNAGTASEATAATANGVEGNTVNALIDTVQQQGGAAIDVLKANRSAELSQSRVDLQAIQAQAGTDLSQLGGSIKTYAPDTPVRTPQPLEPVVKGEAAPGVASPSLLGTVFSGIGSLAGGIGSVYKAANSGS